MPQAQAISTIVKNPGKIFVMYEGPASSCMRFLGEVEEEDIPVIKKKCKDFVILVANQRPRPSSFPNTLSLDEENLAKNGFEIYPAKRHKKQTT
jgi:hypothetical protein